MVKTVNLLEKNNMISKTKNFFLKVTVLATPGVINAESSKSYAKDCLFEAR